MTIDEGINGPGYTVAYECLRQLIKAFRGQTTILRFARIDISKAVAPAYSVSDPDTDLSLALLKRLGSAGPLLTVVVKLADGRTRGIDLPELAHASAEETLEALSARFIQPCMVQLAAALIALPTLESLLPEGVGEYDLRSVIRDAGGIRVGQTLIFRKPKPFPTLPIWDSRSGLWAADDLIHFTVTPDVMEMLQL